jgi:hypothetical protein
MMLPFKRRRASMARIEWRSLALEPLVNGEIGLDATLDAAVATSQDRFGLRTAPEQVP